MLLLRGSSRKGFGGSIGQGNAVGCQHPFAARETQWDASIPSNLCFPACKRQRTAPESSPEQKRCIHKHRPHIYREQRSLAPCGSRPGGWGEGGPGVIGVRPSASANKLQAQAGRGRHGVLNGVTRRAATSGFETQVSSLTPSGRCQVSSARRDWAGAARDLLGVPESQPGQRTAVTGLGRGTSPGRGGLGKGTSKEPEAGDVARLPARHSSGSSPSGHSLGPSEDSAFKKVAARAA